VLAQEPGARRVQRLADRTLWPTCFGGCHTARDTVGAIARAGFAIEEQRRFRVEGIPRAVPASTHALGRARRP
jgi:hypothetical protein